MWGGGVGMLQLIVNHIHTARDVDLEKSGGIII